MTLPRGRAHLPADRIAAGATRASTAAAGGQVVRRGGAAAGCPTPGAPSTGSSPAAGPERAGAGGGAGAPRRGRRRQRGHARVRRPRLLRPHWDVEAVATATPRWRRVRARPAGPRADRRHDARPRRLRAPAGAARRPRHARHPGDPAVGAGRRGVAGRGPGGRRRRLRDQAVLGARADRPRRGAPQAEGAARAGGDGPAASCSTASRRRAARPRRRPRSSRRSTASASAWPPQTELTPLVQSFTDEATRLAGAQFGAFFYNVVDDAGRVLHALRDLRRAPGGVREVPAAAQHRAVRAHLPRGAHHPPRRRQAGPALRAQRAPSRDAARATCR